TLWALLNSPIANAFAHTHSTKRDVLIGTLESMPIPNINPQDAAVLERAVSAYLKAASVFSKSQKHKPKIQGELFEPFTATPAVSRAPTADDVRLLHWRVDAEVLRLYDLSADLERKLLAFFAGIERRGVPFRQVEYFPTHVNSIHHLSEVIA